MALKEADKCIAMRDDPPHYLRKYPCSRRNGHGPGGLFCWQHGRMEDRKVMPEHAVTVHGPCVSCKKRWAGGTEERCGLCHMDQSWVRLKCRCDWEGMGRQHKGGATCPRCDWWGRI